MVYFLLALLGLLWGLSFLGTKIALEMLAPIEVLAVRWMIAFLLFLLLIAFKAVPVNYRGKPVRYLVIAAALQPCIYALLETWGVKLTTSSESSIFIAVIPIMVVVEGFLFLKKKVSGRVAFAICLSFSGVLTCIVFAPDFSTGSKFLGYIVLLATVVTGAAYTLFSNRISQYFTSLEITFALAIGGSFFFNLLSLAEGNGLNPYRVLFHGGQTTVALLYLGIGCSCAAYLIFNYSLSRLSAAVAATIQTNSITVVGVVAGILIGGEGWGWYTVVGLILTITGICISSLSPGEKAEKAGAEPETGVKGSLSRLSTEKDCRGNRENRQPAEGTAEAKSAAALVEQNILADERAAVKETEFK